MMEEINLGGVYAPALLVQAGLTLLLSLPLRWVLSRLGVYRFVWHRGLFDVCLLVILLGIIAAVSTNLSSAPLDHGARPPSTAPHPAAPRS
jgi:hypothetical protein